MSSHPSFLHAAVGRRSSKPAVDDTCPLTWSGAWLTGLTGSTGRRDESKPGQRADSTGLPRRVNLCMQAWSSSRSLYSLGDFATQS